MLERHGQRHGGKKRKIEREKKKETAEKRRTEIDIKKGKTAACKTR